MTAKEVVDIIYQALRYANESRINDVSLEQSLEGTSQVVLTSDDGNNCQIWVLDESGILETD